MRAIMAEPSIDISPLLVWWQGRRPTHERMNCVCCMGGECDSYESLARRVRVSHSTMFRRIRAGRLTVGEADSWAIAVGVHPLAIWPNWDSIRTCKGWRCDE